MRLALLALAVMAAMITPANAASALLWSDDPWPQDIAGQSVWGLFVGVERNDVIVLTPKFADNSGVQLLINKAPGKGLDEGTDNIAEQLRRNQAGLVAIDVRRPLVVGKKFTGIPGEANAYRAEYPAAASNDEE